MTARTSAALSSHPTPAVALGEVLGTVVDGVGMAPDLAVVFVAGHHVEAIDEILDAIDTLLAPVTTLAAATVGLIGGGTEIEQGDALMVWAGSIGEVEPVRLEAHAVSAGSPPAVFGLPSFAAADPEAGEQLLLLLADPYSFPPESLFEAIGLAAPGVGVVGGLVNFGSGPGHCRLWLNGKEHADGAVGVVLPAGSACVLVSQGCRPIGEPWVVTSGGGRLINELAGRPAMERLDDMVAQLSAIDRGLASRGLHIGVVANNHDENFRAGDFLIRGVIGGDRSTGVIAIGGQVEVGDVVQFQVRDGASAAAELEHLLGADPDGQRSKGSLVFTCNGRGERLFGERHQDSGRISDATEGGVGGLFCAGELGPVGWVSRPGGPNRRTNAVHGFTATVVQFC